MSWVNDVWFKRVAFVSMLAVVSWLASIAAQPVHGEKPPTTPSLAERVANLEAALALAIDGLLVAEDRVAELEAVLTHVRIEEDEMDGLAGPHLIFEGCNVHVRSGSGSTAGLVNGRGNLIVGYNEPHNEPGFRDGSHNLVIGQSHGYSSYGGLVAGRGNRITGLEATVSGGRSNWAIGEGSSVNGGTVNRASGDWASVNGGNSNLASGDWASVNGGSSNEARGIFASVNGGLTNLASGDRSSVLGGFSNTSSALTSVVIGGSFNSASIVNSIAP